MSEAKVGVTEFAFLPVKEGYKPAEGHDNLFGIQPKGYEGGHYGWQLEDPSVYHWTLHWESLDAHKALMESPVYGPFKEKVGPWTSGVHFFHAALTPHPPTAAFEGHVTELAKFYLKKDVTKDEFTEAYHEFEVGLTVAAGYHAHSGGWSVEDENCFVLAIGWDSKEAHVEWKENGGGMKWIGLLRAKFERAEMWHIKDAGAVTLKSV